MYTRMYHFSTSLELELRTTMRPTSRRSLSMSSPKTKPKVVSNDARSPDGSRSRGKRSNETARASGTALGYFFIVLVCVIWIAASFLVARLEAHGLSPVLLCFICSSGFIVLVPLRWREILEGGRRRALGTPRVGARAAATGRGPREDGGEPGSSKGASTGVDGGTAKKRVASDAAGSIELVPLASVGARGERDDDDDDDDDDDALEDEEAWEKQRRTESATSGMYSFEYHAKAALVVSPIWTLAQLAFDYSLLMTTVTANSMLSSSSAVFTFMVSVYLGLDRFTWMKVGAVAAYVCGTALVTLADREPRGVNFDAATEADAANNALGENIESPMLGNLLALIAAGLYALYTAVMKLYLKDDERTDMTLFFALMGIFNFLGMGAVILILRAFGGLPGLFFALTPRYFWLACSKAFFDNVLSDYLWARAVLLTSPTVASIGLSLQIPLAASVEVVIGKPAWAAHARNAALMASGTFFVLAGFAGVS